MLSARSPEGRARFSPTASTVESRWHHATNSACSRVMLRQHGRDRVLVFTTNDNETVYRIAEDVLDSRAHAPRQDLKERREILARFNAGAHQPVVTSRRVLNEGREQFPKRKRRSDSRWHG